MWARKSVTTESSRPRLLPASSLMSLSCRPSRVLSSLHGTRAGAGGEHRVDEVGDVSQDIRAVRLVEDLVPGTVVLDGGQLTTGDPLDSHPRGLDGHELVVRAVCPERDRKSVV